MAGKTSTKVFDLAKAQLKMKDEDKAVAALQESVEDNEMLFQNEIHRAKKEVKAATKRIEALMVDPSATPSGILEAQDNLKSAEYVLASYEAIFAERF